MRKLVPIFLLLLLVSWRWKKEKNEIPPGTVRVGKNFFVDATEIRNVDWREFQYWTIRHEGWDSAQLILPDTLSWRDIDSKFDPFVELYYRHPAYSKYPVVGISYEKAKAYAKWRTHRVLEYMLIRDKKDIDTNLNPEKCFTPKKYFNGKWQNSIPDSNFKFPVYRLPTTKEWLYFSGADSLNKYPFGFEIGKRISRRYRMDSTSFLCYHAPDTASLHEIGVFYSNNALIKNGLIYYNTAPVRSGFWMKYPLYNTIGNVSEITSKKGIAMGGNYELPATKINLQDSIPYEKAERWLGFRCVAEFMNWKKYQEYLSKN